mmetsp:Transcript_35084/g.83234  ORF Transcript_35084/g.83234 Transcript_35084/m.83234 type:complete len:250 (-) Transcript_35084:569-1318(-)
MAAVFPRLLLSADGSEGNPRERVNVLLGRVPAEQEAAVERVLGRNHHHLLGAQLELGARHLVRHEVGHVLPHTVFREVGPEHVLLVDQEEEPLTEPAQDLRVDLLEPLEHLLLLQRLELAAVEEVHDRADALEEALDLVLEAILARLVWARSVEQVEPRLGAGLPGEGRERSLHGEDGLVVDAVRARADVLVERLEVIVNRLLPTNLSLSVGEDRFRKRVIVHNSTYPSCLGNCACWHTVSPENSIEKS